MLARPARYSALRSSTSTNGHGSTMNTLAGMGARLRTMFPVLQRLRLQPWVYILVCFCVVNFIVVTMLSLSYYKVYNHLVPMSSTSTDVFTGTVHTKLTTLSSDLASLETRVINDVRLCSLLEVHAQTHRSRYQALNSSPFRLQQQPPPPSSSSSPSSSAFPSPLQVLNPLSSLRTSRRRRALSSSATLSAQSGPSSNSDYVAAGSQGQLLVATSSGAMVDAQNLTPSPFPSAPLTGLRLLSTSSSSAEIAACWAQVAEHTSLLSTASVTHATLRAEHAASSCATASVSTDPVLPCLPRVQTRQSFLPVDMPLAKALFELFAGSSVLEIGAGLGEYGAFFSTITSRSGATSASAAGNTAPPSLAGSGGASAVGASGQAGSGSGSSSSSSNTGELSSWSKIARVLSGRPILPASAALSELQQQQQKVYWRGIDPIPNIYSLSKGTVMYYPLSASQPATSTSTSSLSPFRLSPSQTMTLVSLPDPFASSNQQRGSPTLKVAVDGGAPSGTGKGAMLASASSAATTPDSSTRAASSTTTSPSSSFAPSDATIDKAIGAVASSTSGRSLLQRAADGSKAALNRLVQVVAAAIAQTRSSGNAASSSTSASTSPSGDNLDSSPTAGSSTITRRVEAALLMDTTLVPSHSADKSAAAAPSPYVRRLWPSLALLLASKASWPSFWSAYKTTYGLTTVVSHSYNDALRRGEDSANGAGAQAAAAAPSASAPPVASSPLLASSTTAASAPEVEKWFKMAVSISPTSSPIYDWGLSIHLGDRIHESQQRSLVSMLCATSLRGFVIAWTADHEACLAHYHSLSSANQSGGAGARADAGAGGAGGAGGMDSRRGGGVAIEYNAEGARINAPSATPLSQSTSSSPSQGAAPHNPICLSPDEVERLIMSTPACLDSHSVTAYGASTPVAPLSTSTSPPSPSAASNHQVYGAAAAVAAASVGGGAGAGAGAGVDRTAEGSSSLAMLAHVAATNTRGRPTRIHNRLGHSHIHHPSSPPPTAAASQGPHQQGGLAAGAAGAAVSSPSAAAATAGGGGGGGGAAAAGPSPSIGDAPPLQPMFIRHLVAERALKDEARSDESQSIMVFIRAP